MLAFLLPIILATPCIPIDVIKIANANNQITIQDSRLYKSINQSTKFIKQNLSFIELCFISKTDIQNDDPFIDKYKSYNFWYNRLRTKIPYAHVGLLIHPVTSNRSIGGLAVINSYLDARLSAISMAWCNNNIISCKIIIIHEILHTLGAKHHSGIHIMAPYIYGKKQLLINAATKTEVRRYLKRKGVL